MSQITCRIGYLVDAAQWPSPARKQLASCGQIVTQITHYDLNARPLVPGPTVTATATAPGPTVTETFTAPGPTATVTGSPNPAGQSSAGPVPGVAGDTDLLSLTPVNFQQWNTDQGVLEDSLGNTYTTTHSYVIVSFGYGEYYVNGQYGRLDGTVVPHKDHRQDTRAQVKVYADDTLKYTSPPIDRKTEAFSLSVDITGAKFVKVEATSGVCCGSRVLLMDFILK